MTKTNITTIILTTNALSIATVGIFGGVLLSESMGPLGWAVGIAAAILLATGSVFLKLSKSSSTMALVAMGLLTAGLAAGRINHGLHESQAERAKPRAAALAAQVKCKDDAKAYDAERRAAYKASGGTAPTATYKRYDEDLKAELNICRAMPVPTTEPATLSNLSAAEWFTMLAPVIFEAGCALAVKMLAGAWVAVLLAGAKPKRRKAKKDAKRSAAAKKGWETRRRKAAEAAKAAA